MAPKLSRMGRVAAGATTGALVTAAHRAPAVIDAIMNSIGRHTPALRKEILDIINQATGQVVEVGINNIIAKIQNPAIRASITEIMVNAGGALVEGMKEKAEEVGANAGQGLAKVAQQNAEEIGKKAGKGFVAGVMEELSKPGNVAKMALGLGTVALTALAVKKAGHSQSSMEGMDLVSLVDNLDQIPNSKGLINFISKDSAKAMGLILVDSERGKDNGVIYTGIQYHQQSTSSCCDNVLLSIAAMSPSDKCYVVYDGNSIHDAKHILLGVDPSKGIISRLKERGVLSGEYKYAISDSTVLGSGHYAKTMLGNLLWEWWHRKEIAQLKSTMHSYGISSSLDQIFSKEGYKKCVLKLHPDRGGSKTDFQFYNNFRDKFLNQEIGSVVQEVQQHVHYLSHQFSVAFKILDVGVDCLRTYYKPTGPNIMDTAIGGAHLFSMTTGIAKASVVTSVLSVGYAYHENGIYEAAKSAIASAAFMAVPYAIVFTGVPYVGLGYTLGITAYTGVNLMNNVWLLYQELNSEEAQTESIQTYQEIYQLISNFSGIGWFSDKAHEHKVILEVMQEQSVGQNLGEILLLLITVVCNKNMAMSLIRNYTS